MSVLIFFWWLQIELPKINMVVTHTTSSLKIKYLMVALMNETKTWNLHIIGTSCFLYWHQVPMTRRLYEHCVSFSNRFSIYYFNKKFISFLEAFWLIQRLAGSSQKRYIKDDTNNVIAINTKQIPQEISMEGAGGGPAGGLLLFIRLR